VCKSIFHWISDVGINARYKEHCGKQLEALDSWNKNCSILCVRVCFRERERVCFSVKCMKADPSGREVIGLGLRSLDWWYRMFESRRDSRCSVAFILCCVGSGFCDHELFYRTEDFYRVCECLSVSELETSNIRRPRPELLRHRRRGYAWARPSSVVYLPCAWCLHWDFNTKRAIKANVFAMTFRQQYS
jgi:hypothetical protein